MAVYKFKIIVEDNDEIYREIEILSGQTFADFHAILQEAFLFDNKHAASFFVSDDYWRKDQEITLREADLPLDDYEIKHNVAPKKLMSATKIAKFIEQPRQRFMYVFDPVVKWAFCIELMKILPDNPATKHPAIVKSLGTAPKQYKTIKVIADEDDLDGGTLSVINEAEVEESEIYKAIKNDTNGIDAGDLNHLEGEEGEDLDSDSGQGDDDDMGDNDDDDEFGGYGDSAERDED